MRSNSNKPLRKLSPSLKLQLRNWRTRLTQTALVTGDAGLALCYPARCQVCDGSIESWHDGVACAACWAQAAAAWQAREYCSKCGVPLAAFVRPFSPGERVCGLCRDFKFTVARACGIYAGALLESILWLKRHPQIAPRVRRLLCQSFDAQPALQNSECILPVPLHPTRLAERGFNQAELLAAVLARHTGLRVDTVSLLRVKNTERHRTGMGARERAKSLNQAFRVRAPRLLAGRTVLLVDDVMTTGTTAHELAQTLLEGGAHAVNVLILARATTVFV